MTNGEVYDRRPDLRLFESLSKTWAMTLVFKLPPFPRTVVVFLVGHEYWASANFLFLFGSDNQFLFVTLPASLYFSFPSLL